MGCIIGHEKRRDCFPQDQALVRTIDRRVRVDDKQRSAFPYNSIGYIQSKQRYAKQDQSSLQAKGTGYLIAENLILTSSHNFAIWDQTNKEVKEYKPLSFSLQQLGTNGLFLKSSNIKGFKVNTKFVAIINQIMPLKKMYYSGENDDRLLNRLENEILVLEAEAIQHDFALLELQQKFDRPQYFQLSPYLSQGSKLTVTGYEDDSNCLFTHSNTFFQKKNAGIFYDIDTKAGQSGCPVYLQGDPRKVAGIHKGYDPVKKLNFATMITQQMIWVLEVWAKEMNVSFETKSQIKEANELWKKGDQFKKQEQLQKAVRCYDQALSVFSRVNGKEPINWAITLYNIGDMFFNKNQFRDARECYNKALLIFDKLGKETVEWANTLNNIGLVYYNQDKSQQALEYYCKALTIHQKIKNDSIESANTFHNIGNVYNQNKYQLALKYYGEALTIFKKLKKPSIQWANTLQSVSAVYKRQELTQKARQFLDLSTQMKNNLK